MGNKYSCGHRTSEYTSELLECVTNVENTSNTLVETLDYHIPLVKKLLTNRVTGVPDTCGSGPSHNRQQLHYHHLEKIDDEKNAVKERVADLLHAVQKKYKLRGKLKKEQEDLKTWDSKSGTLEKIELNDLESYITRLEKENKRLHEQNQTLISENDPFKRKLEHEREDSVLSRKTLEDTDKAIRLFQINVRDTAKNKARTARKNDGSLFQGNKKTESILTQDIHENVIDQSEIIPILKRLKEYELGRALPAFENGVQEKLIENLTLGVKRLIDENRSFKESQRKVAATQTHDRVSLEKQVTDLKQEVEQLRINAKLFEEQMDTLKASNNTRIAELNETTNELTAVRKANAETERVWMSKKRDLENLLLEKESNSKIIESQRSEKSKLEKQIIDINLEVEQLRAKAKLFDEQTDTLKSENKANIKKLNETTNELEALRESTAETEKALMLKTQENQDLQLEKDINSKVIATQTSANKTLEKQITDLKHEVEQLRMNAQLFEEQMDTLKAKNNAIIAELNETTTELATVRKSNTEMENALISKTEDYKNLQLEKESNCKKLATQNSAKKKLEKQITDLKQEVEQHIIKANLLEEQMDTLKTQNNACITELNETTNELAAVRKSKAETERALMSKKQDFENLQLEYESLKQDFEKSKRTKVIHVHLYHYNRMSLIAEIEKDLKALLKIELEDAMTKVDFLECDNASDIDLNNPVLILCVCASRIGTDATNAIQALKLTSKMALVILHHKEEHALPKQASERLLTGQMFMRLGGVLDLAFLQGKGIYNCEMNIKNIQSLVHFLKKESAESVE